MCRGCYRNDFSDHDAVVTGRMHRSGAALERGQGAVQQRHGRLRATVVGDEVELSVQGRPRVASQSAPGRSPADSTLSPQIPASTTASWKRASRSTQTSRSNGSRDTEVSVVGGHRMVDIAAPRR
jgi:hypothetical protein